MMMIRLRSHGRCASRSGFHRVFRVDSGAEPAEVAGSEPIIAGFRALPANKHGNTTEKGKRPDSPTSADIAEEVEGESVVPTRDKVVLLLCVFIVDFLVFHLFSFFSSFPFILDILAFGFG